MVVWLFSVILKTFLLFHFLLNMPNFNLDGLKSESSKCTVIYIFLKSKIMGFFVNYYIFEKQINRLITNKLLYTFQQIVRHCYQLPCKLFCIGFALRKKCQFVRVFLGLNVFNFLLNMPNFNLDGLKSESSKCTVIYNSLKSKIIGFLVNYCIFKK